MPKVSQWKSEIKQFLWHVPEFLESFAGGLWTWIGLLFGGAVSYFAEREWGPMSALIIAALTGFGDLSTRFSGSLQISSDGHPAYKMAVGANFDLDRTSFAQLVKIYGQDDKGHDVCIGSRKEPVFGTPDIDLVSTSYVERSNLMLRTINRRYTRLTNAFSKKLENHGHMIALGLMSYNFCTKHGTLKSSPAVAAGVAGHVWTMDEVVRMIDAHFAEQLNAKFEAAFAAVNITPQRTHPKSYTPTPKSELPVPWYLQGFKDSAPGDSELP